MTDTIHFQSGNIIIGSKVARFGSTSYPIANIGSVSTQDLGRGAGASWGVFFILVGIIFLAFQPMLGLGIITAGTYLFYNSKHSTALLLRTSSGDVQAFRSHDPKLVNDMKEALEAAFMSKQ
ncbi:hypothetical protein FHS77_003246 [Paenochrobactrum gallinarii]|uniref:QacE n=1 Tax=Paenochrobactrum gallinarii TaxID=643673 RepID=A0A841MAW1_9HYPH|nr:DUF6232 family protein [Paenochrobactrum gallinarii]MBB6262664.1 hypothetical protein [Paenochrobactrum gallinarii]